MLLHAQQMDHKEFCLLSYNTYSTEKVKTYCFQVPLLVFLFNPECEEGMSL
jgi:hypothetical protein